MFTEDTSTSRRYLEPEVDPVVLRALHAQGKLSGADWSFLTKYPALAETELRAMADRGQITGRDYLDLSRSL